MDRQYVCPQSVLISRANFTLKEAVKWLNRFGFADHKVDITKKYYRFRQKDPKIFKYFVTEDVGDGNKIIFGY